MFKISLFISCLCGLVCSTQIFIGDLCIHKVLNQNATCQLISNCPSAIKNLKEKHIVPENCGFDKQEPIVCCTVDSSPIETSAVLKENDVGYKSSIKCKEYGERVFEEVEAVTLLINGPKKVKLDTCVSNVQPLIITNLARAREFPHMALIGFDKEGEKYYICSGSLISERYVLTAAHCLVHRVYGNAKYVRLGTLDVTSNETGLQERSIEEIIRHPNFHQAKFYNDIGLIKLDKNVEITRYVRPICLSPNPDLHSNRVARITWPYDNFGSLNETLQKDVSTITELERCQTLLSGRRMNKTLVDTQICVINQNRYKNCQMDDGPIQVYHHDVYCMFILVGVKSFGSTCSDQGLEVYTNVTKYLKWIEDSVWP